MAEENGPVAEEKFLLCQSGSPVALSSYGGIKIVCRVSSVGLRVLTCRTLIHGLREGSMEQSGFVSLRLHGRGFPGSSRVWGGSEQNGMPLVRLICRGYTNVTSNVGPQNVC